MTDSNTRRNRLAVAAAACCVTLLATSDAHAQAWNEEPTVFEFSEPVMVPGTTLAPGRYEFRLIEPDAMQGGIRITTENGIRVVATVQAVPVKREQVTENTVLAFAAHTEDQPAALKAWFYPNSLYGHEFIYPEPQAREIADRDQAVVLSVQDDGVAGGIIYEYDGSGGRREWRGDPEVLREWREWMEEMPALSDD